MLSACFTSLRMLWALLAAPALTSSSARFGEKSAAAESNISCLVRMLFLFKGYQTESIRVPLRGMNYQGFIEGP